MIDFDMMDSFRSNHVIVSVSGLRLTHGTVPGIAEKAHSYAAKGPGLSPQIPMHCLVVSTIFFSHYIWEITIFNR